MPSLLPRRLPGLALALLLGLWSGGPALASSPLAEVGGPLLPPGGSLVSLWIGAPSLQMRVRWGGSLVSPLAEVDLDLLEGSATLGGGAQLRLWSGLGHLSAELFAGGYGDAGLTHADPSNRPDLGVALAARLRWSFTPHPTLRLGLVAALPGRWTALSGGALRAGARLGGTLAWAASPYVAFLLSGGAGYDGEASARLGWRGLPTAHLRAGFALTVF